MKIGIIAHDYYPIKEPFKGGLEMFTHLLVKELVLRKHIVNTLCLKGSDLMGEMTYYNEVIQNDNEIPDNLKEFATFYSSLSEFLSNDFDVIHNNSISHHAIVVGSIINVPFMTTFHCPLFDNIRIAINSLSKNPNQHFTTVSEHLNLEYKKYLKTVQTVHNGTDLDNWKEYSTKENYFSWCGRICKEKGLLEIMDLCNDNDIKLKIAGPISDQDYFDEFIKPRLEEHLKSEYLGHLKQTQVNELMSRSKAFLFSSIWNEPYGMVIAEALASGTPVIAHNAGAAGEIITEKCGILFNIYEPETFKKALLKLKTLKPSDCRKRAEDFCSHIKMVDQYEKLYAKIVPFQ